MGYLNNSTRLSSITIGGVDYTSSMESFTCSDSSAFKNGLIATTGSVVLRSYGDSPNMEDYTRDNFRRGTAVIVNIQNPDGSIIRHPRGLLYVITTSFEPESNSLNVEVGCKLTLAALTEDVSELLPLVPIQLDVAQQTYGNISASFAAAGQYLFQNNQGNYQSGTFFDGDSTAGVASGQWLSVLGLTAVSVRPLQGSAAIPDQINLTYQVPTGTLATNEKGKKEITTVQSYYFTQYPAIVYITKPSPTWNVGISKPSPSTTTPTSTSGCGNAVTAGSSGTPSPEGGGEIVSCSERYETKQQSTFVPAYRREYSESVYDGPGGQLSYSFTKVTAPAFEINNQFFSDKFAFCRAGQAQQCLPNGNCPMFGLDEVLVSKTETTNFYGRANELIKQITDEYRPVLSAAQPSDWRSGNANGILSDFVDLEEEFISNGVQMFRATSTITEYLIGENGENIQEQTTWTSIASRQSGIYSRSEEILNPFSLPSAKVVTRVELDALKGIKTFQRRTSRTVSVNPIAPDIVNTVTTSTSDVTKNLIIFPGTSRYIPEITNPYIIKEQIPVPILSTSLSTIQAIVNNYSEYLRRFVIGDAFGLSIAESLRPEITNNWKPGMPFRYYDATKQKIFAMRADACTWGVNTNESLVEINAIWLGVSNGSITVPNNLVGDSRPIMEDDDEIIPPDGPGSNPIVEDETYVNSGNLAWFVDVNIGTGAGINFWGEDGVLTILPDTDGLTAQINQTFTIWCEGIIVAPGDLLNVTSTGSIPLSFNGSLLVEDATVIDVDLFA